MHWTLALALIGCNYTDDTDLEPNLASTESTVTWGADDRTTISDADFATWVPRSIGLLNTGFGICSATYLGDNWVITNRHCVGDTTTPPEITFHPAFTGPLDDFAARPRIGMKRIVRGTGADGKFNTTPPGTYVPGGDWALLEVDPATFQPGTGVRGITFPESWSEWPSMPLGSLPTPITTPISVSSIGYSFDIYSARNKPSIHKVCSLRTDGACNAALAADGDGLVRTSCEFNGGASGGPIITPIDPVARESPPVLLALNAGHGAPGPCYNDDIGNIAVKVNGFVTAPRDAAGFTFTRMGNGVTLAVASDASSFGHVRWNNFDTPDGFHPKYLWQPWDSSVGTGVTFGRMASAMTGDNHAFIFALTSQGIQHRFEADPPGSWSAWSPLFPGSAMASSLIDIEASTSGSTQTNTTAVQVYTLHSDGRVLTRRKMIPWYLAWGNEQQIGQITGARAIGVGNVQGFQQAFVITASSVLTAWEAGASQNIWTSWVDFTSGLPSGLELLDIAVGQDSLGRMEVYVLVSTTLGARSVFQRTKSAPVFGASWGNWSLTAQAMEGADQIEVGPPMGSQPPRLTVARDGEIWMRRQPTPTSGGLWAPAYSPEPTPPGSCPAPLPPPMCP